MKIKGFSLVELLIATLIMALLNITIWQLLRGGIQVYRKAKILAELQRNAEIALDEIRVDYSSIRSYGTIACPRYSTPADTTELDFRRVVYSSASGQTFPYVWYGVDAATHTLTRGKDTASSANAKTAALPIAQYCTSSVFGYDTASNCLTVKLTFTYPGVAEDWGTLNVSTQISAPSNSVSVGGIISSNYCYQNYYNNSTQTPNPLGGRLRFCHDY